ncbi:MAG: hypothetical protein CTY34_09315 [Methylobacter sp.]|nr:MAG: hypothetical protein CTY34_09315 [Methylobacter sp.]PPD33936.1 MAG: hypothetical protein CTY18_08945 [Methylomonas sp.]
MINYFATLPAGKIILWCYLIWYLVTVYFYFDPAPAIWLNSLGISVVIGFALMLSVSRPPGSPVDYWQIMRLFLMPFCVSSFSSLIKGHGFILILPPKPYQQMVLLAACLGFIGLVYLLKLFRKPRQPA